MRFVVAYGATLLVFLGLDFSFILGIASATYRQELGPILLSQFHPAPSILFYLLYVAGVVVFVVKPALDKRQWARAALLGAAFGLVAYSTYDLTNLATLKGFTLKITLIDLAWGTVLTSAASSVGYAVAKRFG